MAVILIGNLRWVRKDQGQRRDLDTNIIWGTNGNEGFPHVESRFTTIKNQTTNTVAQYDHAYAVPPRLHSDTNSGQPVGAWRDARFSYFMYSTGRLDCVDIKTGKTLQTVNLPANTYKGLTGDGRYFWTIDQTNGNIIQFDWKAKIISSFTCPTNRQDLHCDGRFLHVWRGVASSRRVITVMDGNNGGSEYSWQGAVYGANERALGIAGNSRFIFCTEHTDA